LPQFGEKSLIETRPFCTSVTVLLSPLFLSVFMRF